MHPLVRDLYKRFLIAGRYHPQGLAPLREKIKEGFQKNKDLWTELEIKKAVSSGRYWVREINAITRLTKYRLMKRRYDVESERF